MTKILPYQTEKDIKTAEKVVSKLYSRFDKVKVYPYGLFRIRIEAK